MAGTFRSFMSGSVPIKRWRLYTLYFLVFSFGLVAIEAAAEWRRYTHTLWVMLPVMAAVVTVLNFLADWRRDSGQ